MKTKSHQEDYAAVLDHLRRYYDGLYHLDTQALSQVFAPSARYASVSSGDLIEMGIPEYLPRLAAREAPSNSGAAYGYHVDSITFAGPATATARLRCSLFDHDYTDLLTLVRLNGEWRIQSKVFHAEPVAS